MGYPKYPSEPSWVIPVGQKFPYDGDTATVVAHDRTFDGKATIVTFKVEGVGYGAYTVEDNR